jgi:hypothetical protein
MSPSLVKQILGAKTTQAFARFDPESHQTGELPSSILTIKQKNLEPSMSKKIFFIFLICISCLSLFLASCNGIQATRAMDTLKETQQSIEKTQQAQQATAAALDLQKTLDVALAATSAALQTQQAADAMTQTAAVPTNTPTLEPTDTPMVPPTATDAPLPSETATLDVTATSVGGLPTATNSASTTGGTFTLTNCNSGSKTLVFQISSSGFYTEMTVPPDKCKTVRLARGDYNYYLVTCDKRGVFHMDHNVRWYWRC